MERIFRHIIKLDLVTLGFRTVTEKQHSCNGTRWRPLGRSCERRALDRLTLEVRRGASDGQMACGMKLIKPKSIISNNVSIAILVARRGVHLARCHRWRAVELDIAQLVFAGVLIIQTVGGVAAGGGGGEGQVGAACINGRACEKLNSKEGTNPNKRQ